jgi:hypothetical protein
VAPGEVLAIFRFKVSQAGVEEFPLGYEHHVEPRGDLVETENLSYQSLSSISLDRAAELACRRDPQPPDGELVRKGEQRGEAAVNLDAPIVDLLELGALTNPLVAPET